MLWGQTKCGGSWRSLGCLCLGVPAAPGPAALPQVGVTGEVWQGRRRGTGVLSPSSTARLSSQPARWRHPLLRGHPGCSGLPATPRTASFCSSIPWRSNQTLPARKDGGTGGAASRRSVAADFSPLLLESVSILCRVKNPLRRIFPLVWWGLLPALSRRLCPRQPCKRGELGVSPSIGLRALGPRLPRAGDPAGEEPRLAVPSPPGGLQRASPSCLCSPGFLLELPANVARCSPVRAGAWPGPAPPAPAAVHNCSALVESHLLLMPL